MKISTNIYFQIYSFFKISYLPVVAVTVVKGIEWPKVVGQNGISH